MSGCRELQHTHGGHFKFWRFVVAEARVTYHWGRIGTAGQTRVKTYANHNVAYWEANSIADVKLSAGYHEVTAPGTLELTTAATYEKTPLTGAPPAAPPTSTQGAAGMHKLAHAMKRAGSNAVVGQKDRKRKEADEDRPARAITLGEDL